MRALAIVGIIILGLIALWAGCSMSRGGVTSPETPGTQTTDGLAQGEDALWGVYHINVDIDAMAVDISQLRASEFHVNVTDYILPPLCSNCVTGEIVGFDPITRVLTLNISLHNNTEYYAYDVRGILFLSEEKGHDLANPDGYTKRLDKSDPKDINPYIIWKEGGEAWQFPGGETLTEEVQVVMPTPMSFAIDFAVVASFPVHSKDPMEIEETVIDGVFHDTGWLADVRVKVHDWQDDVSCVYIDLSPFGPGNIEYPTTLDVDGYWKTRLQYRPTIDGAPPPLGTNKVLIRVVDSLSKQNLYDYVNVEVTEDTDPPTWGSDVGIKGVATGDGRAVIYHATATDPSAPVDYFLYYSQSSDPYEGDYVRVTGAAHYTVGPLTNGIEYVFGARAIDRADNIDDNVNYRTGTPQAVQLLWAKTVASDINSNPNLADLDGDSDLDVVFGCDDGKVVALDGATGDIGWYLPTGGSVVGSPALVDINLDGLADVVIGSGDGKLYGIRGNNGTELGTFQTQNVIESSPVVCDYGENGTPDAFIGSNDEKVYGLNILTLSVFAQYDAGSPIVATPCLAYMNPDEYPDVLVCAGGDVHGVSGTSATDLWSTNLGLSLFEGSPAMAIFNDDNVSDAIVGTSSGVYAIDGFDGSIIWSRTDLGVDFETDPALADLNCDGRADVAISGALECIYTFDGITGNLIWQAEGSPIMPTSPVIADVTGDGRLDVIAGSLEGHLRIYNGDDGLILADFFTGLAGGVTTTPAVGDIDHDGYVDIVFGTEERTLVAITTNQPMPPSLDLMPWPRFHRNRLNQGNLGAPLAPSS
jgi:outer membrane protein assembly factor BamB